MSQFVYVISNPAMPGLIKIGKTCNITDRLRQLSASTSVPFPFELHYAAEIRDDLTHDAVESALHSAFRDCRVNEKREFFRMLPDRVIPLLELLSKPETVQDEDPSEYASEMSQEFQNVSLPKRCSNRYSLIELGIPIGSVLHFRYDDKVTCTVVDDRHVDYEGEVLTLSRAAVKAWKLFDRHYDSCASGWDWTYEGEQLLFRRRRFRAIQIEQ